MRVKNWQSLGNKHYRLFISGTPDGEVTADVKAIYLHGDWHIFCHKTNALTTRNDDIVSVAQDWIATAFQEREKINFMPAPRGTYGKLTRTQQENGFVQDLLSEIKTLSENYNVRLTVQKKNGATVIGVYLPSDSALTAGDVVYRD